MKTESETRSAKYIKNMEIVPEWTEEEKKIIAWSICWEGSIGLYRGRNSNCIYARIDIGNTNFELLEEFKNIVKIGRINKRKPSKSISNAKPQKAWVVCRAKDIYYLLKTIFPYLPSKRRHAELVIEFLEQRLLKGWTCLKRPPTTRELEIFKELKTLYGNFTC